MDEQDGREIVDESYIRLSIENNRFLLIKVNNK